METINLNRVDGKKWSDELRRLTSGLTSVNQTRVLDVEGRWWTLGSPPHPRQLNAVIKAALDLLECDNTESAKALLRAFSGDSAISWPYLGQSMAESRPDVGQNPSEVVE